MIGFVIFYYLQIIYQTINCTISIHDIFKYKSTLTKNSYTNELKYKKSNRIDSSFVRVVDPREISTVFEARKRKYSSHKTYFDWHKGVNIILYLVRQSNY